MSAPSPTQTKRQSTRAPRAPESQRVGCGGGNYVPTPSVASRLGLDEPHLLRMLNEICEQMEVTPDEMPYGYRTLALAALHDVDCLITTYIASYCKNSQSHNPAQQLLDF